MASDLHTHTIFSDGSFSPEELVAEAKKVGLNYLAVTDHDTVDGVKYLYENGLYSDKSIKLITGIEFSALNSEHDIHIIGYDIDIYDGGLSEMVNDIAESRWERFSKIIENLQKEKFNIRETDVLKTAGDSKSIGRFHIAKTLVKMGAFKTVREVFDKMLSKGRPAYAPRYFPEINEIVEVIHNAGGKAVLAHPLLVGDDELVEKICQKVDGLEIFYPCHKAQDVQRYKIMAVKYNLVTTGGSDFHGVTSRFVNALGEFTVSDEIAKQFYRSGDDR